MLYSSFSYTYLNFATTHCTQKLLHSVIFFEEIHSVVSMWHMKPSFMEDVVDLFQLNLSLSSIGSNTIHSKASAASDTVCSSRANSEIGSDKCVSQLHAVAIGASVPTHFE
jgi:hypothetical protein